MIKDPLSGALHAAMAALTSYHANLTAGATPQQLEATAMTFLAGHRFPDAVLAVLALALGGCQMAADARSETIEAVLQHLGILLASFEAEEGRNRP